VPSNRVVVIAGGSSGVGRASARMFVERGDRVVLLARGEEALAATAEELARLGGAERVMTFSCDVTDRGRLDEVVDAVQERWGGVDVWVNAAVVVVLGRFDDVPPEDFERVVDVVLLGTVNGSRAALRSMLPRDSGRIVQVGSAVALHGVPLQSAYATSKHAVHGFCDSLRAELLHDGSSVTVSEVNLPAINTPLYSSAKNLLPQQVRPFPPIYQPEVAARAVVRAADTGARRIDVSATTSAVAAAEKLASGVYERLLGHLGVELQQTGAAGQQPAEDYVHKPLPGDHGCHGEFDDVARTRSYKETLRALVLPEQATAVVDQSRRLAGAVLAEGARRIGLVPRR
jgi:NAD(P)-dependent dehydrogenase (short-subunit alcohol dehydrogenase family)